METKKKLRCPLGVPGGIIAALIGLSGIVCSLMHTDQPYAWHGFAVSLALFLLAGPFVRITGIDLENLMQKHLSERQKEAVQLLLEGYSQRKIASRMQISQKCVNILIKKAIRKLRYFFM